MIDTNEHTVTEVADMLGLHPVTVRRYIRQGIIKPVKRGKEYLLTQEHIQKLPHNHKAQVTLAEVPNLEPMQDLLTQINKTFVQFSEQNASTAQGIAQEYSRSVRPIVTRVTGEATPEMNYETLKAELLEYIQKPMHRMLQNMMLIKKAMDEKPELQDMPIPEVLDWFIKSMVYGLDADGFPLPETFMQGLKDAMIQQSNPH